VITVHQFLINFIVFIQEIRQCINRYCVWAIVLQSTVICYRRENEQLSRHLVTVNKSKCIGCVSSCRHVIISRSLSIERISVKVTLKCREAKKKDLFTC